MDTNKQNNLSFRQRIFRMVSVGVVDVPINQLYDIVSTAALIINLIVSIMLTYENMRARYNGLLSTIEGITVAFFAVDFFLRMFTAKCLYPQYGEGKALLRYVFSFAGIIDLMSWLPYYLPFFFPTGAAAFRFFRVARIFRLFRINAYYDSLNVITEVLMRKRKQLLSSVFIILVLILASSLCMYSIEHEAQPDVFTDAFSGVWWAASTLLTIGYGDIYPITVMGQILSIVITFLGVGMVAIPTGIISAGFVEQYQRLKNLGNAEIEENVRFIHLQLESTDAWVGKKIRELGLPKGAIIAAIQRNDETFIPRGEVRLKEGDRLIIGAESLKDVQPITLSEIELTQSHEWCGQAIRDLDISRQTFIVMVRRGTDALIPNGDLVLLEGDVVILYSKVQKDSFNRSASRYKEED